MQVSSTFFFIKRKKDVLLRVERNTIKETILHKAKMEKTSIEPAMILIVRGIIVNFL